MNGPSQARRVRAVLCPFCALLCDDLAVAVEGERLEVIERGCARAVSAFATPVPADPRPQVAGEPVSFKVALARAAELLRTARLPLFAGLEADLTGLRAVVALAERTGGVVDAMAGEGARAQLLAVARAGWVATTLAEARNRPDLVLLVGDSWRETAPRLFERVLLPAQRLARSPRRILQLGGAPPAEAAITHLPVPEERLGEVLAAVRALLRGRAMAPSEPACALIEALRAASYRLLVWTPTTLPSPVLTLHHLTALTRELNAQGRAAGLALAASPGAATARQLLLWQAGVPDPLSFADGAPEHDPFRWSGTRLLAEGGADLLLWIDALGTRLLPVSSVPVIALVRPGCAPSPPPAVMIPVATPGLDHAGDFFRTDSVVALRARPLRTGSLPSVAEVLATLMDALARESA